MQLPDAMAPYVARMDFIIGVRGKGAAQLRRRRWDGTMYINMIRNIREPELESHFLPCPAHAGGPSRSRATSAGRDQEVRLFMY